MKLKRIYELTSADVERLKELTPQEQHAVDTLLDALRALPPRLHLSISESEDTFAISKRISVGYSEQVARLRKKSLFF